jgi:signal transduction histidine kinase
LQSANGALESAQQRLLETQEKLLFQEKMASMGQLVAGVAHEVNTPLGIAITASSFLHARTLELSRQIESGTMRKSELDSFLTDASNSGQLLNEHLQRAAGLIAQFKQLSIPQNFDARQRVPLNQLMEDVIRSVQPLWQARPIVFVYAGAPRLALDTYTGAITQLVSQLLQNAMLHAFAPDQAGTITLSCLVLGELDAHEVEISVADTGVGMHADQRARVFEPFFTTKRNQGGTGLGLHIVFNSVTARLGGTITVDSEPGQGTRFTARFPACLPSILPLS